MGDQLEMHSLNIGRFGGGLLHVCMIHESDMGQMDVACLYESDMGQRCKVGQGFIWFCLLHESTIHLFLFLKWMQYFAYD